MENHQAIQQLDAGEFVKAMTKEIDDIYCCAALLNTIMVSSWASHKQLESIEHKIQSTSLT